MPFQNTFYVVCKMTALLSLLLPGLPVGLTKVQTSVSTIQPLITSTARMQTNAHKKRALLVGISKYERVINNGAPWRNLDTKNDLELLADVLIRRFQFDPEEIRIISDDPIKLNGKIVPPINPTHKVITDLFRSFLIERTQKGDVVFFYFAGHGSQVPDDDKNKDELDGCDETLVPIDYVSDADGSNDIRDDEIGDLLDALSKRNPSNVTIALDSCFSGTATRGDYDVMRGGLRDRAPALKEGFAGEDETIGDFLTRGPDRDRQSRQNYVFLSASSSRQPAVETFFDGKKYGVFTYALARALEAAGPTTTYRDIYERVLREVSSGRKQRPQIEGDQLDNIFLQDGALPPESYITVRVNKYGIFLSAGSLQGMTVGSKFALYPPATKSRSEGKPIAEARIIEVRATDSTLKVEGAVAQEVLENAARAFEISRNYESVLKVVLKDVGDFAGLDEMLKKLGLAKTVPETSPTWNVLIRAVVQADRDEKIAEDNFRGVILQRREGKSIFAKIKDSKEMCEEIKDALISEAKRITLTSLDNTNPDIKIEMRLIPIEVSGQEGSSGAVKINKVPMDKKEGLQYSKSGNIEFKVNDRYRLEVRNLSKFGIYITILNLDADGKISPVFPMFGGDNLIKEAVGSSNKDNGWAPIKDQYIRITEPLGLESMHAIATKEKTDFSPLFDPGIIARGKGRGGSFNGELLKEIEERRNRNQRGGDDSAQRIEAAIKSPLGQIFIATQEGKGVRDTSTPMPPPTWSTATVSYVIVK